MHSFHLKGAGSIISLKPGFIRNYFNVFALISPLNAKLIYFKLTMEINLKRLETCLQEVIHHSEHLIALICIYVCQNDVIVAQ